MMLLLVLNVVLAIVAALVYYWSSHRTSLGLAEARADAEHWYGRLSGQVMNLQGNGDNGVTQALSDAAERFTAAGAIKSSARTCADFRSVTAASIEGLYFVRAARHAMGLDPGPELPVTSAQSSAGQLKGPQSVTTSDGQRFAGAPQQTAEHPYFYPGGELGGRSVPGGWYSQPFWKGAALGGIAAASGALLLGGIADTVAGGGFGNERWWDADSGYDDEGGGGW